MGLEKGFEYVCKTVDFSTYHEGLFMLEADFSHSDCVNHSDQADFN